MLKKILTTLDGLNEHVAALYTKKDDGKFHLNVEDDDGAELRRAKEHEVGLRKIAEQERDTARAELATAQGTITQLTNDAGKSVQQVRDQLKAEYEASENKLKEAHNKEKAALERTVKKVFVEDVALRIATDLTDVPDLLMPLLQNRLQVEIVDGEPVTRVLTADGKASAMTPDQLKAEYLQDKRFERIIRGNDASGGGANGGKGGSGAPTKLSDMSEAQRATMAREQPAEFQRLVDAAKGATA